MAVPAFAYGGEPVEEVEQPVLTDSSEEDAVTVTDESSGALTPEGNLTLVDDYHTSYSDGSGQQFITLVSKSGATFYLVIDRNAKGATDRPLYESGGRSRPLALMKKEAADAYTAEKKRRRRQSRSANRPKRMRKRLRKKRRYPVLNRLVATKLRSMLPHS
ncbi:MAG: CD1107 family mobile element protein [Butyricicoccus sp.]